MRLLAILMALALASCGVAGPPVAPNGTHPSAGVMLSGSNQGMSAEGL